MSTGVSSKSGFTIIEVMIFLAISAAMFISVIILFGGVQQRNQFVQSMRDIDSRIQDVINDVSTGYFDELKGYQCIGGSGTEPQFIAGGSGQGTNQGCVFLGKVILLAPGTKTDAIEISPVVGNRLDGTKEATTYTNARPTTVFDGAVDLTVSYDIRWGANITSATVGGAPVYAAGFYGSLASYSGDSTAIESGAQRVAHFRHNILGPGASRGDLHDCISNGTFCGHAALSEPWIICFTRSDGGETAQLSIGGSGTLTTKLEFINC